MTISFQIDVWKWEFDCIDSCNKNADTGFAEETLFFAFASISGNSMQYRGYLVL